MIQTVLNGQMMALHAENAHGEHTIIPTKRNVSKLTTHVKPGAKQMENV